MKLSLAVAALIGTQAIKMNVQRHHHHHRHDYQLAEKQSIPACNSYTFPKCVKEAETAAPMKLQADQDKHDKDYFVPNFGVDHDVITTQSNLKNAETSLSHTWKLAQQEKQSIPACNSYTFPKCVKEAETAAPMKLQADQDKHDKDYFVPNFGVDHDVITTQSNLKNAEKTVGHQWKLSQVQQKQDGDNVEGAAAPQNNTQSTGNVGLEYEAMANRIFEHFNDGVEQLKHNVTTEMVNFAMENLGVDPKDIPSHYRTNATHPTSVHDDSHAADAYNQTQNAADASQQDPHAADGNQQEPQAEPKQEQHLADKKDPSPKRMEEAKK